MIKTLRITIIVTAIVAGVFFVLSGMFGFRHDKDKEAFLAIPTVTAAFKNGTTSKNLSEQDAPLVQQAKALAQRINPPKPIDKEPTVPLKPIEETAKFRLLGTSFFALDPNKSMALIDESGKGMHWVMESDQVDRFTITHITDGKITYSDGQKSKEMMAEKPSGTSQISVMPADGGTLPPSVMSAATSVKTQQSAKNIKENAEFIKKLMNDPSTAGVSKQEASELENLGEFLKQLEKEQAAAEGNDAKVETNSAQPAPGRPDGKNEVNVPQE